MTSGERSSGRGTVLHIATTGRAQPVAGAVCVVLGVCLGGYLHRAPGAAADPTFIGLAAAGLVGFGAWLAGLRTSVELDRGAMTATSRWRWLFLHGEESVSAVGRSVVVERAARGSSDVDVHEIMIDGVRLRKVTETDGGREEAEASAKRMASHLGIPFGGVRDGAARRREDERKRRGARFAMVPLLIVGAVLLLALVYMTLLGPVG